MVKKKSVQIEAKIKLAGLDIARLHSLAFSPFSLLTYLLLKEKAAWSDFERVFVKNPQIHVTKQTLNKYLKQCLDKNIVVKVKDEKTGRYYYKLNNDVYLKIVNSADDFYSQLTGALALLQHELTRMMFAVKIMKIRADLRNATSVNYVDHCLAFGEVLKIEDLKRAVDDCEKAVKEFIKLFASSEKMDLFVVFSEIELNEIVSTVIDITEKTVLLLIRGVNYVKSQGKVSQEEIAILESRILKMDSEIQSLKRKIRETEEA